MAGEILAEDGEGLVLKKPTNQVLAAGECMLLASYTRMYGQLPLHTFSYRLEAVSEHNNIHMLYETTEDGPDIAVAFMLIGWLSSTVSQLYVARNRELSAPECNSGPNLWILENCCPFGHFKQMKALMEKAYSSTPEFKGLVEMKPQIFPNKVWKNAQGE